MVPEGVSEKREAEPCAGCGTVAVGRHRWARDCRRAGRWDRVSFGQKEAVSRLWHSA